MTRRERLERKAERRREWADKARVRSEAGFRKADSIASMIPLGQPILVGHHSEKRHRKDIARIDSGMRKGCEEAALANHHESKADGLERQLASSIYSDDPDAVEQLTAKAEALEAEADKMAAANKAFRKLKAGDGASRLLEVVRLGFVTEADAVEIAKLWALCPYHGGTLYPAYQLSNTRANARRCRERIKTVEARARKQAEADAAPGGVVVKRSEPCRYSGTVYATVTFAEKPAREVLAALKAAGYYWGNGSWTGDAAKLPPGIEVAT